MAVRCRARPLLEFAQITNPDGVLSTGLSRSCG
jgi:hypothetical protein